MAWSIPWCNIHKKWQKGQKKCLFFCLLSLTVFSQAWISLSNFAFPTSIPICRQDFSQFATSFTTETTLFIVVMDQHLESNYTIKSKRMEINDGEHPNKCNQCEYSSSYTGTLRRHLKTHSGEKPNKCNQCDFASSHAGDLRRHLKTHSGERSNKCNQCDYASAHASNLRRHLKMHSGEKSNKCNQ